MRSSSLPFKGLQSRASVGIRLTITLHESRFTNRDSSIPDSLIPHRRGCLHHHLVRHTFALRGLAFRWTPRLCLHVSAEVAAARENRAADSQSCVLECFQCSENVRRFTQTFGQLQHIAPALRDTHRNVRPDYERRIADNGDASECKARHLQIEDRLKEGEPRALDRGGKLRS